MTASSVPTPENFVALVKKSPVVAILRRPSVSLDHCVGALIEAGLRFIEITMDSPGAERFLQERTADPQGGVWFGAGTVTTLSVRSRRVRLSW